MAKGKRRVKVYGFYLMVFGILLGLNFAGNMITFYVFYELMTLLSMPLVIHTRSREAVMAALKYMFYSFCGAYMALFGLYFYTGSGIPLRLRRGVYWIKVCCPGMKTCYWWLYLL